MGETAIQKAILYALEAVPGCVFWRNNTGRMRRRYSVGLGVGSADLIGVVQTEIASKLSESGYIASLAFAFGRFAALEIKDPKGKTSPERAARQKAWRETVREHGGFAAVVTDVAEALEAVGRCKQGEVR